MSLTMRFYLEEPVPFAEGYVFGSVGPYERRSGRFAIAVSPQHPAYRMIVDLDCAPRNHAGDVEYSTEVCLLKPVDMRRGNRRLLYDVINRGNKRAVQFFNDAVHSNTPTTLEHAGNGFLMRRGYTIVWSAWQGDILPGEGRMTMTLPTAFAAPGASITGVVRAELLVETSGVRSLPLSGNSYTHSYPTADLDTSHATLTVRAHEHAARQPLPPTAWQFARSGPDARPLPSATDCYLAEGFRPGWLYELIYTARDPLVMGLGFTALRELLSFLRYEQADAQGVPNPLQQPGSTIEKVYGWGRSQSGRVLREFVYRGFNEDLQGRPVFDGISPHVTGAGRGAVNYRFSQPGRYPRQHEDHLYPSDQFPFAYGTTIDPWSGRSDAILKRPATDPLVIHTQTSSEYWQRRGSLVHTDAFGHDLTIPPGVRIYLFAGSQHHAVPRGLPQSGPHQHLSNPLDTAPLLRALLDALDAWVSNGTPPPPCQIPTRAAATLVAAAAVHARFPQLPNVLCPQQPNRLHVQDYGATFAEGILSCEPPGVDFTKEYVVLVPAIDADGNEVAGLRTPHLTVPLGTFTGWNRRLEGAGAPAMSSIIGSFLPFASTLERRQAASDPRPSLAERYASSAAYVRQIVLAAQRLVEARYLLEEDAERYVEQAMHTTLA